MNIYEHTYIAAPEANKKDMESIENKIEEIVKNLQAKFVKLKIGAYVIWLIQ